MLVESGLVRATAGDGSEFTFRPSFGRIASLGSPGEIVALFAALHGPHAETEAAYVLACLCDQEDVSALIGDRRHWCADRCRPARRLRWCQSHP